MPEEPSDPKIVERLKNIPPFDPDIEQPTEVEEAPEVPQEEQQPTVEAEGEAQTEVKEEEVTEEEQKKRTQEQFEKLKEHNAQLKEELEKVKKPVPTKNALDALIPDEPSSVTNVVPTQQEFPALSNKEIKDVFASLVDPQGYVDSGLLIETLKETERRTKEAELRAQQAEVENKRINRRLDDFERKTIMKEVHEMYPTLNPENVENPDNKFDERFYEAFQGEVMRQWATVGKEDVWAAAKKWSDILYGDMKKAIKEKAEKAELAKKNINATSVVSGSQRETPQDQDELIRATRLGKKGSILERLNRAGLNT